MNHAFALCLLLLAGVGSAAHAEAPKAATYTGRTLSADGKPVAEAEIFLLNAASSDDRTPIAATRSDAEGRFTLTPTRPVDPNHALTIAARAPGFGLSAAAVPDVPDDPVEITCSPATALSATFLDPAGKPVPNLAVGLRRIVVSDPGGTYSAVELTDDLARQFARTTDARGVATFENLPERASLQLDVSDPRFARVSFGEQPQAGDAPTSPPTTVHLKTACEATGTVTYGPTGQPAPGIRVYAQSNHAGGNRVYGGGAAVTDDHGRYHLDRLEANVYNLMIATGDIPDHAWTATAHEGVRIDAGQTVGDQNFTLIKGALITGRVVRGDTRKGFPGVFVGLYGPAHPSSSAMIDGARTSGDGSYTLRTPPGANHVYLSQQSPDGYDAPKAQDVTVADGQTLTVDFKLPRRRGKPVTGRVIGPDGDPVSGAYVSAEQKDRDMFSSPHVTADAEGNFRFEAVTPGTLLRAGRGASLETPVATPVDGGESDVTLTVAKRLRVTLTGLVTDTAGKPIPGARVDIIAMTGQFGLSSGRPEITDATGRYRIKGLKPDGRYTLQVTADRHSTLSLPVTLVPGDEVSSPPPIRLERLGK